MDTNLPSQTPDEVVPEVTVEVEAPRSKTVRAEAKEPVEVTVVRQEKDLMLVAWRERNRSRRAWVTPDMVVTKTDNVAMVTDPGSGIPYGVEWRRLVELDETTPAKLEQELYRRGIWTLADLRANPQEVVGAFQAAYGFARAQLLQAAERYEQELKQSEKQ